MQDGTAFLLTFQEHFYPCSSPFVFYIHYVILASSFYLAIIYSLYMVIISLPAPFVQFTG